MIKPLIVLLLFLALPLAAENGLPELGPRSILKYFRSDYDGTKVMGFGYICGRANEGLKFVRNEIVAKYGRPFKGRDLRDHFQSTGWYVANPAYHDGLLTKIDGENINRIQAVENGLSADHPLLKDLREGRAVRSEKNEIQATYDQKDKKYVFKLLKRELSYTNEIKVAANAGNSGGPDWSEDWLFLYKNILHLVKTIHTGMRGETREFYVITFHYNIKTRTLFNIAIPDSGEQD